MQHVCDLRNAINGICTGDGTQSWVYNHCSFTSATKILADHIMDLRRNLDICKKACVCNSDCPHYHSCTCDGVCDDCPFYTTK